MGTADLQREIKSLLGKLNWSQKRLGRELYIVKCDYDDDDEIRRYEEKVKKHLSRSSTDPELLQCYLDVISQHSEFKNLDIIIPQYRSGPILSETMEEGMKNISKLISKMACE